MIIDYEVIYLKKGIYVETTNGSQIVGKYEDINPYYVKVQEIEDDINASIYGANIKKMKRLTSLRNELETYLEPKVDNVEDNVSNYFIFYKDKFYKIISVNSYQVEIERL